MRWSVIEYHGIPWNIEERHHGTSMEYLWNIVGPPMNIKQYHGMPIEEHVTSKDYHWNSFEIQGRLVVHLLAIYGISNARALVLPSSR